MQLGMGIPYKEVQQKVTFPLSPSQVLPQREVQRPPIIQSASRPFTVYAYGHSRYEVRLNEQGGPRVLTGRLIVPSPRQCPQPVTGTSPRPGHYVMDGPTKHTAFCHCCQINLCLIQIYNLQRRCVAHINSYGIEYINTQRLIIKRMIPFHLCNFSFRTLTSD